MTKLTADEKCVGCGSLLVPPSLAFGVIVRADADYVCVKCRRAYWWTKGNPPRLVLLTADSAADEQT